jgi:hypothetical protein
MSDYEIIRPKTTERLKIEVCRDICQNPGMSSRQIIKRAIERNPRDAIYFYSKKCKGTLTLKEQQLINDAPKKREAKKLYEELMNNGETYELNTSVVNRIKSWWNKKYISTDDSAMPIYGAVGMGYISEDKLTSETAARWLYPRIKQIQHEGLHWSECARIIEESADSTSKEKVADNLRKWKNKVVHYNTLKGITSELHKEYID